MAIHGHRAIARTGLPRFARNDGAGVDVRCGVALLGSPRHCEERSDVAIHGHRAIACTGLPRFARNDGGVMHTQRCVFDGGYGLKWPQCCRRRVSDGSSPNSLR